MRNDEDDIGALEGPPERLWHLLMVIAVLIMAFIMVAASAWLSEAEAHQAPTGWTFDPRCCGNGDCYPVQDDAIRETPSGYLVEATGEVIPYQSTKVLPSPDGLPYRCSVQGNVTAHTYCLYLPKGGV